MAVQPSALEETAEIYMVGSAPESDAGTASNSTVAFEASTEFVVNAFHSPKVCSGFVRESHND